MLTSAGITASSLSTSYFRGSIPSALRLTAHMLANLRLKIEITLAPPRFSYPAAAQPYRGGNHAHLKNTTLPGRTKP